MLLKLLLLLVLLLHCRHLKQKTLSLMSGEPEKVTRTHLLEDDLLLLLLALHFGVICDDLLSSLLLQHRSELPVDIAHHDHPNKSKTAN